MRGQSLLSRRCAERGSCTALVAKKTQRQAKGLPQPLLKPPACPLLPRLAPGRSPLPSARSSRCGRLQPGRWPWGTGKGESPTEPALHGLRSRRERRRPCCVSPGLRSRSGWPTSALPSGSPRAQCARETAVVLEVRRGTKRAQQEG